MTDTRDRTWRVSDEELLDAIRELNSTQDVATYFGVTRQTIWRWTQRPTFRALVRSQAMAVQARLESQAEDDVRLCMQRLRTIVQSGEDHAAVNATAQIMRLHGNGKVAPLDANTSDVPADEDSADALQRALEITQRRRPELSAN